MAETAIQPHWGSDTPTAGNYVILGSIVGGQDDTNLDAESEACVLAGTAAGHAFWSSAADGTTDIKVWVDGGLDTTISNIGANEQFNALSITTSDGTRLANEFDGGTNPGIMSIAITVEAASTGYYTVHYGGWGNASVAGQAGQPNRRAESGAIPVTDSSDRDTAAFPAGTLEKLAIHHDSGDATTDYKVWVDGAVDTTLSNVGAGTQVVSVGSVISDAKVAVEHDAGTLPGSAVVYLVSSVTDSTVRDSLSWGGDPVAGDEPSHFLAFQVKTAGPVGAVLNYRTEIPMFHDTNPTSLAVHTEAGDGSTDLKVLEDGAVVETLSNIGSGTQVLSPASLAGTQGVEYTIEFDGGTGPNNSCMALLGMEQQAAAHARRLINGAMLATKINGGLVR